MISMHSLLRAAGPVIAGFLLVLSNGLAAAPLITIKGEAEGAKYPSDSEVRITVTGWAEEGQVASVVEAFRDYSEEGDGETFVSVLREQETLGYLFTKAATGYAIKYATRDTTADGATRMVFLITPALKTRNPVLWEVTNDDPAPFTLVELHWQDEENAVMKTSLDGEITVNEEGRLVLEGYSMLPVFANMEDSTPYYLRDQS